MTDIVMGDELEPTTKVEIVQTTLRSMWEAAGRLDAEAVVEAAEAETHPLHSYFEWDDTEAARKWRLWQAGNLIRSVKILVSAANNGDVDDFKIREWLPARTLGGPTGQYLPEDQVRQHPEQQARLLRQMRRELAAAKRKYAHMQQFWEALARMQARPRNRRLGEAWHGRRGLVGRGPAPARSGLARLGSTGLWPGVAWQAGRGLAWLRQGVGEAQAGHGMAGAAW